MPEIKTYTVINSVIFPFYVLGHQVLFIYLDLSEKGMCLFTKFRNPLPYKEQ